MPEFPNSSRWSGKFLQAKKKLVLSKVAQVNCYRQIDVIVGCKKNDELYSTRHKKIHKFTFNEVRSGQFRNGAIDRSVESFKSWINAKKELYEGRKISGNHHHTKCFNFSVLNTIEKFIYLFWLQMTAKIRNITLQSHWKTRYENKTDLMFVMEKNQQFKNVLSLSKMEKKKNDASERQRAKIRKSKDVFGIILDIKRFGVVRWRNLQTILNK